MKVKMKMKSRGRLTAFSIKKKIAIFLVAIGAVFALSCSDDSQNTDVTKNPQLEKQGVSFEEFKRATGLKSFKTTMHLPHLNPNGMQARLSDGSYEFDDFIIDTEYIRKVAVNEKETYTFWVTPKVITEKSFFNLIVYKEAEDWEMTILEFMPSDDFLNKYEAGISTAFEGNVARTYTLGTGMVTLWVTWYHCTGTGPCSTGVCDMCNQCVTTDAIRVPAAGPEVEVVDVIAPNPSISGGNNGGGFTPNISNPYNFFFGENFPSPGSKGYKQWKRARLFFNSLSEGQKVWVNQTPENTNNYLQLLQIYLDNPTDENKDWAKAAIAEAAANPEDGFTPTNYPGQDQDMPFEWWKDPAYIQETFTVPDDMNLVQGIEPNEHELILFQMWPTSALIHISNANAATSETANQVSSGNLTGSYNGKADAFRHTFFSAMDTAEIGATKTRMLMTAHELDNPPRLQRETTMDLHNNNQGIQMSLTYNFGFFTSNSEIRDTVLVYLSIGNLRYLSPLEPNGDLLPESVIIPTNQ